MTGWPESEVERVRQLLRAAVKESGTNVTALEQKVGAAEGSLRRVLNGQVKLSLRYILLIADGLGMSWGEFFCTAFPAEVQEAPGERGAERELDRAALLALLQRLENREPTPAERVKKKG